jgi:hypothetical protein
MTWYTGGKAYREIVIESFMPTSSSGHRGDVLLRPIEGQYYPSTMLVEASRHMRDTTRYRLGTRFVVQVCVKQKDGCKPHLYCNYRDPITTTK